MKLKAIIAGAALAMTFAGQGVAATLSIIGGADYVLPSGTNQDSFNTFALAPELAQGTTIKRFTTTTIVGNGLNLSGGSNLVYTFIGSEANKTNRAFEIASVLFQNKTTAEGTSVDSSASAGLLDFTYSTNDDALGNTSYITNGVGGNPDSLSIGFFQIDSSSVYALFGDGVGDQDMDDMIVKISAVPLPAGVLLMLTALGGMGYVSRRKAA